MQNEQSYQYYSELISKYLSGNASDAEVQELEAWVLADEQNKARFVADKKAWMLSGMTSSSPVATENAWEQMQAQIKDTGAKIQPIRSRANRRSWLAIAASLALLLAIGLWLVFSPQNESLLASAADSTKTVDLQDGSQVTLNQFASLEFTTVENKRIVKLKGDAFFDVARDETQPFVIQTDAVSIEVLGTSFYVDARKEQDEVQVVVRSGSVAVRASGKETILKANEKAVFQKTSGELNKEQNNDPNFTAILNNKLVFDGTPLRDVVFTLNRQFHSNISVAENIAHCPLEATFDNKSLKAILAIIDSTFEGISVKRTGNKTELTGVACD